MGWVVNATPRPLYPRERHGTYCIGGWVGPRAGLDRCGNSRPHRDSPTQLVTIITQTAKLSLTYTSFGELQYSRTLL